jgi:hypothetical protein
MAMNWKRIQETCKTAVRRAAAPWARTSPPVPAPVADEFARASTYTASYRWGAHGEAFVARNGGHTQIICAGYRPRAFDTERRQSGTGREETTRRQR